VSGLECAVVVDRLPEESLEFPDELAQLPHGRHGLPAEFVRHNQRQRLIVSFTNLVGEVGFNNVTIGATTAGAGVSSRTFYAYFETIDDCYLGALEEALGRLGPYLLEAFESETEWQNAVRAALLALLEALSDDHSTARLLTSEPFVAGAEVAERFHAALGEVAPYLAKGRELSKIGEQLPESTERSLLGAASSLIGRHTFSDEVENLVDLLPDLVQFILTPYLGPAEARRIALGS
jgi:AcrR family transcriptional regulator